MQNGEARAAMDDINSYEHPREMLALLKALVLGTRQIEAGKIQSAKAALQQVRRKRETF